MTDVIAAVLEFPDDIEPFVAWCREQDVGPETCHIVALWPDVQVKVRRAGLPYATTLPYFTSLNHRSVVLRSEEWLQQVEAGLQLRDDLGCSDAYNAEFVFHLRFYINYFLWAVAILDGIRSTYPSLRLVVRGPVSWTGTADVALGGDDRPFAAIAARYGAVAGVPVTVLAGDGPAPLAAGRRSAATSLWAALESAAALVQRWRFRRYDDSAPTVIVTSLAYHMDRFVQECRDRLPPARWALVPTYRLHPLRRVASLFGDASVDIVCPLDTIADCTGPAPRLEQSLDRVCDRFEQQWRDAFIESGVRFVEIFGSKIRGALRPHVARIGRHASAIHAMFKRLRPRLVVSAMGTGVNALIGEAARRMGVPSLSISHGTFVSPRDAVDAIESRRLGAGLVLTTYGYTALQTPWTERYLQHFSDQQVPVGIRTGSLVFARVDRIARRSARAALLPGLATDTRVIVYATTLKPRSSMRFHSHETLDEHLEGVRALVIAAAALKNVVVVIKLHPAAALKQSEVVELVPEAAAPHVRVMLDAPFERVLATADLLVSYSSTCIEEALHNRIPVLLFDPWRRYQHLPAVSLDEGLPTIASAVYAVSDTAALTDGLRWLLARHGDTGLSEDDVREHVYDASTRREFDAFIGSLLHAGSPTAIAAATATTRSAGKM